MKLYVHVDVMTGKKKRILDEKEKTVSHTMRIRESDLKDALELDTTFKNIFKLGVICAKNKISTSQIDQISEADEMAAKAIRIISNRCRELRDTMTSMYSLADMKLKTQYKKFNAIKDMLRDIEN